MEINWWVLGIVGFCGIILVIYLIIRNLKDEEIVAKSFNDEIKDEKRFELDDAEEN